MMEAAAGPVLSAARVGLPRRRGRVLSLSLDLDNLWSYMKTHGDPGWERFPTYLDAVVDEVVACTRRLQLPLTVFVVGQDAALDVNRRALARLAEAGFEIGNHSFKHEPWLHLYPPEAIEAEIAAAEDAITAATGHRPVGFRGPGFSLSDETLRVLCRRGYEYDCSTFPTFLGPLARLYYFWHSRALSPAERRQRARLFGTVRDGLAPLHAYRWAVDGHAITELPVTTMPILRVPIHMSYLLYLATISETASRAYLRTAVALCRAGNVEPSFLLHPLDFIGAEHAASLAFFPAMGLPSATKRRLVEETLSYLAQHFTIVTMREHARRVVQGA
jgi:peptidoglycan/xylan/chitin deacetylase (PgdA/CDA1 family)